VHVNELVVLGLGNVLMRDDGVGVVALHRLRAAYEPPPGVRLVDAGALGLPLLDLVLVDPARELLLLGAARGAGLARGTLVRRPDVTAGAAVADLIGVGDLLAAARWIGRTPAHVTFLGLVAGDLGRGGERTPEVEAANPTLIAAALAELEDLGRPLRRRHRAHEAPHPAANLDVALALGL
jgi:hydrogenase maturation protease